MEIKDVTTYSEASTKSTNDPLEDFAEIDEDSFHGNEALRSFKSFAYKNSPLLNRFVQKAFSPKRELIKNPVDEDEVEIKLDEGAPPSPIEEKIGLKLSPNVCYAPPGKLGVAIDCVDGVAVVHKVKPGSPLEGILTHLDRIVAIDDTDTTKMSASEVTRLMVSNMDKSRKIYYIRKGELLKK